MVRFRDSVNTILTVLSGFHALLPEKLEAKYKSRFLPFQVRFLLWMSSGSLAFTLAKLLFVKDLRSLTGLAVTLSVFAWIYVKPASTVNKAACQYLFIIFVSVLSVLTLPGQAWLSGLVLIMVIILIVWALIGFTIFMPLAVSSGLLVCLVYLAYAGIFHLSSPLGLASDSMILIIILTMGILAGYTMGFHHRKRFAVDDKLSHLQQKLSDYRENQHDELVRMNTSLALEIRAHTEAETRLKESDEKYKNLVESLPQGIFIEQDDKIVLFNPGLERLTGINSDRLSGMAPAQVFDRGMAEKNAGDESVHEVIAGPDQSKIYIEKQWVKIRFNGKTAKLYTLSDITERVNAHREKERLESELEKAKKMEALGLLAGGVAHDLNNVLSGIVSTPELLLMDLPEDSPMKVPIETIKDSGRRAAVIVDELLTLGRGTARVLEPVSLNLVIEDYLVSPEFLKSSDFHPGVRVKTNLDSDLPLLNASGLHLRKIVMNLVTNAMEAIGEKGELQLTTTFKDHSSLLLKGYEKELNGPYVRLRAKDSGPGIALDDLDRIFEPFYTKKILGRSGTGLGLSIVWNIVHDYKGYIQVASLETGTVFDLYFPVPTVLQDADKPGRIYTLSDYTGQGQSVLIVDDDENQQIITTNMLKRLGYKVNVLGSGEAAIDYLKVNKVDLVVLDMIMAPGMDGLSTFRELRSIDPAVKAVIASGYSKTEDVLKAQALGAGAFIKKPFSLQTLGLAVKEQIERQDHEKKCSTS